ncbi:MAG TPA: c-type cytochrome [Rhizomicrobium sp.]|jgi:cytochrome c553|nr:c-type cytochrome [Rhizomicrobium sp.]
MRRFWKWVGIALGGIALFALAAVAYVYVASEQIIGKRYPLAPSHVHASTNPTVIALGKHLVRPYGCADCHRPNLQGTFIPDFGVSSRNLTRLAATFSDADFDRAIRKGLRPNGTSVAEAMPADAFQYMPDGEVTAIISYIRSLKPAGADIPSPSFGLLPRVGVLAGKAHTDAYWFGTQKRALDLGLHYARGREIAMSACGECHMTALTGGPEGIPGPRPPDLSLVASYERADFLKFMHTGKAAGNRELPMMSAVARVRISHLSDVELNQLYDYLAARGRKLAGMAP